MKKALQGFPGAAIQIRKKIPVVEKIPSQDLRDAENEMSPGNLPNHVGTEPLPEFHQPASDGRRDRNDGASRRRPRDIHGGNPGTSPGKAVMQVSTLQAAVNALLEVGPPEPVPAFEALLV